MKVSYKTTKIAKDASSLDSLKRHFGEAGRWIAMCLQILQAVPNLRELLTASFYKKYRCHALRGDRAGSYSLDTRDPYRLLFKPEPPVPEKPDGGIDEEKVEAVIVTDLHCDTHN